MRVIRSVPTFWTTCEHLCTDFVEIHGDRKFGDDPAIVDGLCLLSGNSRSAWSDIRREETPSRSSIEISECRSPKGYRKALRVMKLAEKFGRPILTFIDTPGAYPGIDAEERGQAEAIAYNLREMSQIRVPIIATVTGEGGSGGALAIGVADRVNMLEYSIYSVIAPESCSAILWRDQQHAAEAAEALKLTPEDLKKLQLIDEIIPEPEGGAHNDHSGAASELASVLERQLGELSGTDPEKLLAGRYDKFRAMGAFAE